MIVPKYLQLIVSGIILATKGGIQWIFNTALVNLIALYLPGFIFSSFSTAHSPKVSRIFYNFSMFLYVIFLYIVQFSEKSNT